MNRTLVICLLVLLAACAVDCLPMSTFATKDYFAHRPVLTPDFVSKVNSLTKGMWHASVDNGRVLRDRTLHEIKQLMGVVAVAPSDLAARDFTAAEAAAELPETFDSAENWPQCPTIREIRDQSNCGSCWAIAAAEAMSDRYCTIANLPNHRVSTGNLLSCCRICGRGCEGGWPTMAWTWWVWVGLTTEDCQPYPFAPCGHHAAGDKYPACPSTVYETPQCNSTCSDGVTPAPKFKGERSYGVNGEDAYMRELMHNGPFEVAFDVYEDFLAYRSGVYSHTTGTALGGHAVRLVGWGTKNGVPYWKVANSWNEDWGDNGYFLIKRGSNECGIEQSGVAGIPRRG